MTDHLNPAPSTLAPSKEGEADAWRIRTKENLHGEGEPAGRWIVSNILSLSADTAHWYEIQPLRASAPSRHDLDKMAAYGVVSVQPAPDVGAGEGALTQAALDLGEALTTLNRIRWVREFYTDGAFIATVQKADIRPAVERIEAALAALTASSPNPPAIAEGGEVITSAELIARTAHAKGAIDDRGGGRGA